MQKNESTLSKTWLLAISHSPRKSCEESIQPSPEERQLAAETRCTEAEDVASQVQERLGTEERLRRHLHNMIQQLKGNIRVCVRVRPLIGAETADCGCVRVRWLPLVL